MNVMTFLNLAESANVLDTVQNIIQAVFAPDEDHKEQIVNLYLLLYF